MLIKPKYASGFIACLDKSDLNLSSKASREIEFKDHNIVFEDDIELNILLKASQESEEEDFEEIIDSSLELHLPQAIEKEKQESMVTINPVTTNHLYQLS